MDDETLPAVIKPSPLTRKWTDRFAMDLAMTLEGSGSKPGTLLEEYGFTEEDLVAFGQEPLFGQRVEFWRNQLKERGFIFQVKAQAQAEELLDTSWEIIHTQDVSPAVKADLIKWTAKMANYEPSSKGEGVGNAVQINIHMGDPASAPAPGIRVIDNV